MSQNQKVSPWEVVFVKFVYMLLALSLSSLIVRLCWNTAVVRNFPGAPTLTYGDAFALTALCDVLFKSSSTTGNSSPSAS